MDLQCKICSLPINGTYYTTSDKVTVCESCYGKTAKCSRCKTLLHNTKPLYFRQKPYCSECCHSLVICAHCDEIISGTYHVYDSHKLCDRCNDLEKCHICRLPPLKDAPVVRLDRKRFICESCRGNAVMDHDALKEVFSLALSLLQKIFGIKIRHLKTVRLVSRGEIIREGRGSSAQYNRNSYNVKGVASSSGDIVILTGESRAMALEVIIHELGHIWQFENWKNAGSLSPQVKEGFCEWLAYRSLKKIHFKQSAERMLSNKDDIYGEGLRFYLDLEKRFSTEELVAGKGIPGRRL